MPKRPTTIAPTFDTVRLSDLTAGDADDLTPQADLEGFSFTDLTLDDLDLESATVVGSRLEGVRAPEANARYATLAEVAVERLDVPVFRGVRGRWRDVEIRGSRLGSAELYESTWTGVHFVGCRLSFVNLRGSALQDVAFTDCTIDELDLGQATVTRMALDGTRIGRLDLQAATLRHADLRRADLEDLVGLGSLAGATISTVQLQQLAAALAAEQGITVAD
ncbi:pentapeptide repeat-containing protein [Puerhibacterium sp. TATVAM-FAB25]|uniref:pentapeptide repeat-containing protein n=1 Tax=Puerhibacterium sp. TATVAM-FAB25 TaxID=3093699 RepID=UPI00397910A8